VVAGVADIALEGSLEKLAHAMTEAQVYSRTLKTAITVVATLKLAALAGGLTGLLPLPLVALIGDDGSTIAGLAAITAVRRLEQRASYKSLEQFKPKQGP